MNGPLLALLAVLLLAPLAAPVRAQEAADGGAGGGAGGGGGALAFPSGPLHAGLGPPPEGLDLETPQGALEHLLDSAERGDLAAAAFALDLSRIPEAERAEEGAWRAGRLAEILERRALIDWERVPDRPDGLLELPAGPATPLGARSRRSLEIGSLPLGERDAELRLRRVAPPEGPPVWLVSPATVANVPALWEAYGPTHLDELAPDWASGRLFGVPLWTWIALLGTVAVAGALGWLGQRLFRGLLLRADGAWTRSFGEEVGMPAGTLLSAALVQVVVSTVLPLSGATGAFVATLVRLAPIIAATWLAMRTVGFFTRWIQERSVGPLRGHDDALAAQRLTWLTVLRQLLVVVVVFIGIGVALSGFADLRLLGTALLTSAGVAGVVVGIAAQPVLGNVIAGLQLALTQPMRIGDNVVVEGEWGYVEEIRYTYLVVRVWDQRRLVVPLRRFATQPFENWTLNDAHMLMPVNLHLDPRADVQAVRERFDELLRADEDWDGVQDPVVQVIDSNERSIAVRLLTSARDPSVAWALHCRLREAMYAWLRERDGGAWLPRERLELPGRDEPDVPPPRPAPPDPPRGGEGRTLGDPDAGGGGGAER